MWQIKGYGIEGWQSEGRWGEEDSKEGREGGLRYLGIISWCIVRLACLFSNIWNYLKQLHIVSHNITYGGG